MNTEKLLFGLGGIVVGFVVGFMFANSVNRSASVSSDVLSATNISAVSNSSLPPNHPPLSQDSRASQGGAVPEVTAAIEKARREPDNFEAQMTAGDLYYQIQRFEDAVKFYEKASRLRPEEAEPLVKLGNAYFDAEQYEQAERLYSAVLKKTPNEVNIRTDLGLTFYLRTPRDVDRAIKEFNAALAIQPDSEIALQNLALALIEKNDTANLQRTLDKLAQVNPNNAVLLKHRPK